MDWKDYLMEELWPLLTDDQKRNLYEAAKTLAMYAPKPETKSEPESENKDDGENN